MERSNRIDEINITREFLHVMQPEYLSNRLGTSRQE